MSPQQHLAAQESNERNGKSKLTADQKADLFYYIAPLTRLLDLFEGDISGDMYDEEITLHSDAFDSNSIFIKDGYPIGFSDNLNNMFYLRPELIQALRELLTLS